MHSLNNISARVKHSSDVLSVNSSGEVRVAEMPPIVSFHADFLETRAKIHCQSLLRFSLSTYNKLISDEKFGSSEEKAFTLFPNCEQKEVIVIICTNLSGKGSLHEKTYFRTTLCTYLNYLEGSRC